MTIVHSCSDLRCSLTGTYGYPTRVEIHLKVSEEYKNTNRCENESAINVRSVEIPGVPDPLQKVFSVKVMNTLVDLGKQYRALSIFQSLKRLDTEAPSLWRSACHETDFAISDSPVRLIKFGELTFSSDSNLTRISPLTITCDITCSKCHNIESVDAKTLPFQMACTKCSRELRLSGSTDMMSEDCTIDKILFVSARIWCGCGEDFCYLPKIAIGKKLVVGKVFDYCGCPGGIVTVSYISNTVASPVVKSQPVTKEPKTTSKYREGYPLPQTGSCKHHKKTFRWTQYSDCCNAWYPCNACHKKQCSKISDDNEEVSFSDESSDSEDLLVPMMCGFFAREQPISDTCVFCNKILAPPDKQSRKEKGGGRRRRRRRR